MRDTSLLEGMVLKAIDSAFGSMWFGCLNEDTVERIRDNLSIVWIEYFSEHQNCLVGPCAKKVIVYCKEFDPANKYCQECELRPLEG